MAYDFTELEKKSKETLEWLQGEYFTIRTGRATPAVLDGVKVDAYGILSPLNQVANIMVEDARSIRIAPYDVGQTKTIEKAIIDGNTGLSVSSDDKGVRVTFPELTSENREQLVKVVKEKLEKARITLRSDRDEVWTDIQKKEKEGEISEDEKFGHKEGMQKIVDEANKSLEELAKTKEEELKN